jgi:4'-phosphopantetheinyl transferase
MPNAPDADLTLDRDAVHVWTAQLDHVPETELSAAERIRAEAYTSSEARWRFTRSRQALHAVLRRYGAEGDLAQRCPECGSVTHGPLSFPGSDLAVSLSRSGDRCLIAIGRARQLGADIEKFTAGIDWKLLAPTVLNAAERGRLQAHRAPAETFYRYWTAKEAVTKALGRGLAIDPTEIDVAGSRVRSILGEPATDWQLRLLESSGYLAAIASDRPFHVREIPLVA